MNNEGPPPLDGELLRLLEHNVFSNGFEAYLIFSLTPHFSYFLTADGTPVNSQPQGPSNGEGPQLFDVLVGYSVLLVTSSYNFDRSYWYSHRVPDLSSTQATHKTVDRDQHQLTVDQVDRPTQDQVDRPTQDQMDRPTQDQVDRPTQDQVDRPPQDQVDRPTQDQVDRPMLDLHPATALLPTVHPPTVSLSASQFARFLLLELTTMTKNR